MPGLHWTAEELNFLKQEIRAGKFVEDIAIEGRSLISVSNQAKRLGLTGDGVVRKPWSDEEKRLLWDLVSNDWTASDIVKGAGDISEFQSLAKYNRNAIQKQIQRMELADKKRSRIAKAVIQFTQAEKIEFRAFLKENYSLMTPEQMAKLWNKTHSTKVTRGRAIRHLELLKCKLPWKLIMSMPYSQNKRKRRAKNKARRKKAAV